ncbi:MAG TPA: acetoin utilization protein AcuC [Miltoncostaeaceae bacterium]|nr:acetoin utilization protein AcuC [Miltoncostaeaceae bacterium]
MTRTAFVQPAEGPSYDLGADHPMQPMRRRLAVDLMDAYGLPARDGVEAVISEAVPDDVIERVHAPAYVAAVRRYSENPAMAAAWEAAQWGLAAGGDTPAFAGMHDAAAAVCGASIAASMAVWEGGADQAFFAGGGLHHALANRASGFCVYNDTAVAIQALLDAGAERVAYIDIDVHHGDGTQWIFFEEPRVLTCSVHETGRYLFPGTGGMAERGIGEAEGTSLNVPLPPFSGDRPYLRAIEEVVAPAVLEFRPDVIVTQDGADPHHADPLAHLQVTLAAFPRAYRSLHQLAREAAGGRWVALGGGGYTYEVVPRAWTMLLAEMLDAELEDEIPERWWTSAEALVGGPLPRRLSADPEPEVPAEERARADVEGDRVVDDARALFLG